MYDFGESMDMYCTRAGGLAMYIVTSPPAEQNAVCGKSMNLSMWDVDEAVVPVNGIYLHT